MIDRGMECLPDRFRRWEIHVRDPQREHIPAVARPFETAGVAPINNLIKGGHRSNQCIEAELNLNRTPYSHFRLPDALQFGQKSPKILCLTKCRLLL